MRCKCQGNYHNQMMGSAIGGCGFFCKLGKGIRAVGNFAGGLGLLPPGVNVLINLGTHAMGADNPPDNPTDKERKNNQQIPFNPFMVSEIGRVPNVF